MMGKIIAVTNQKGGVGKTTTSVNLAASLAATKRRILLIDLDPQGNATMGSGVNKHDVEYTMTDWLLGDCNFDKLRIALKTNYDLLPSNSDLIAAEVALLQEQNREIKLRELIYPLLAEYDFIIIDCPPALNILTVNALISAHSLVIPLQCEYYALEGLAGLINTIDQLTDQLNPNLAIEGILRTMYDGRNRLSIEVSEQLLKHFNDKVFQTVIPRNVRLAEAPSYGLPALHYDKNSLGAVAYLALAGEILRRMEKTL